MLPHQLAEIPAEEKIAAVIAHGANDTRASHNSIAMPGAAAIIPPRRNAKPGKPDTAGARARNEIQQASKHSGRALSGGTGAGATAAAGERYEPGRDKVRGTFSAAIG